MSLTMRLFLLPLLALLAACGGADADEALPADPPYLRGTVTALDGDQVRVEENAGERSGSAKAVLRITPSTRIVWRTGEPAERGDLRLGTRVSAWVSGPIAESYPVQAEADLLLVESTTLPNEPRY